MWSKRQQLLTTWKLKSLSRGQKNLEMARLSTRRTRTAHSEKWFIHCLLLGFFSLSQYCMMNVLCAGSCAWADIRSPLDARDLWMSIYLQISVAKWVSYRHYFFCVPKVIQKYDQSYTRHPKMFRLYRPIMSLEYALAVSSEHPNQHTWCSFWRSLRHRSRMTSSSPMMNRERMPGRPTDLDDQRKSPCWRRPRHQLQRQRSSSPKWGRRGRTKTHFSNCERSKGDRYVRRFGYSGPHDPILTF